MIKTLENSRVMHDKTILKSICSTNRYIKSGWNVSVYITRIFYSFFRELQLFLSRVNTLQSVFSVGNQTKLVIFIVSLLYIAANTQWANQILL